MSGVNKVILIGRLGKDPEVRVLENGTKRAYFTLATSENHKDKEGKVYEQTEWHNIVCWRNQAEFAEQYLAKGRLIYLEGKLRNRSWEENGQKRYITEVEVSTFKILSPKEEKSTVTKIPNDEEARVAEIMNTIAPPNHEVSETDDLPF